jgi:hypothetical protein
VYLTGSRSLGHPTDPAGAYTQSQDHSDGAWGNAIADCGGLRAVVGVMGSHPQALVLQEACCCVFWAVSHTNAATRAKLIGEGCLAAVLLRMESGTASATLLEAACATIANIALADAPQASLRGATSLVAQVMRAHPDAPDLQTTGAVALQNLALHAVK